MVAAEESQTPQQPSAWHPMSLQLHRNCSLPYSIPSTNRGENNLGVGKVEPIDAHGKRFLIFDHSGNQTRLFMSPIFSRENSIIAPSSVRVDDRLLVKAVVEEKRGENALLYSNSDVDVDHSGNQTRLLMSPNFSRENSIIGPSNVRVDDLLLVEEKRAENGSNDEEGEMVEDAEEINALLYSDSDDDEYNDDNDEVSSTRHESLEEGVGSSDGSPKRRKLLDGSCKGSSLARNEKEERVRKIEEAVKKVGSIVPGLKSKDPISIIEKAIVYLERMKVEAIGGGKKGIK